jgi:hypothetical protein
MKHSANGRMDKEIFNGYCTACSRPFLYGCNATNASLTIGAGGRQWQVRSFCSFVVLLRACLSIRCRCAGGSCFVLASSFHHTFLSFFSFFLLSPRHYPLVPLHPPFVSSRILTGIFLLVCILRFDSLTPPPSQQLPSRSPSYPLFSPDRGISPSFPSLHLTIRPCPTVLKKVV